MTKAKTFQEKMATKLLADNLVYHLAGIVNEVLDGETTQAELDKEKEAETLIGTATMFLSIAYRNGHLDSPYSNAVIEAKHLKFLGNAKLDSIKKDAVAQAIVRLVD